MRLIPSDCRSLLTGTTAFSLCCTLTALWPASTRADISGFTAGTGNTNFTLNQGANNGLSVSNNVATLTDGGGNEGTSLFYNTTQNISAFKVAFTYQENNGTSGADGFTFTLQNDSRARTAIGGTGNTLGYTTGGTTATAAISPSVAIGFNLYSQTPTYSGSNTTFLGQNGTFSSPYNVSKALLTSNDPINVSLSYANGTLTETLTDSKATANTSTFTYAVNIPSIVGNGGYAYVGFTGADGGSTATQTISNFSYTVVPEPATWAGGALLLGAAGLTLRRRARAA